MPQLVLRRAFNWEIFSLWKWKCGFSLLRLGRPALALRFPQSWCSMTVAIAVQILLDCGTESSPAETKVPNVYVSFVWCFVLEKPLKVISSLWETQELLLILQFSEVVMNVLSEIAWGIIRDKSGFILKKRGELHQDDFSWTLAMLKSRLAPPLTTKASWSPPRGWSSRTSPCHPCSCHDGQPWQEPPQGTSRGWEKIFTWESLFNYFSNCFS